MNFFFQFSGISGSGVSFTRACWHLHWHVGLWCASLCCPEVIFKVVTTILESRIKNNTLSWIKKRISYNIFSIFEKGGCTCKGGFFVKEVFAILPPPPTSPLQLSPKNILPSSCMNYHRTLQLWMNTFNAIDTTRLEIVRDGSSL